MVNLPMHHVLEDGICRISLNGIVVGAGFLVTDRHILTCAHVVHTQAEGENILSVNFIKVADKELSAELIHSTPIRDDDFVHDIAVLALKEALPSAVKQLPLSFQKNIRGHGFEAIGFTSRFPEGETTEGTISNNQLQGAIQLEKDAGASLKIDRGYSGGALWDTELQAVVGMVVASTSNLHVSLGIPLNYIAKVWLEWQRKYQKLPFRFEYFQENPYKGLDYFEEGDAERFYGRQEEADHLYEKMQHNHFIAVVGNSGTGKSSVVFAGLVPKLQQDGNWTVLDCRPDKDILRKLSESLVAHFEPQAGTRSTIKEIKAYKDDLQAGTLSLAELGEREKNINNHKLLLIINQFEEFFTLGEQDEATKNRFLELLVEAVASQHIHLIITIRTDFLSYVYKHAGFGKLVRDNSYTILPIEGEAKLAQVITLPDQHGRARMQLSPEFKARIIEDASGELALLQFALEELWERRQDGALTYEAYKEIGGVKGALERKAEDFMQSLKPAEQQQVCLIMFNLLKLGEGTEDTKRVASRAEIGEENWQMVSRLADERLLKTGEDAQGQVKTAEIIHEALIRQWTTLRDWLDDKARTFIRWREGLRHQLKDWQKNKKTQKGLLQGLQLEQAKVYVNTENQDNSNDFQALLSEGEHNYVQQSVREDDRRTRRRALTRVAVVVGLSVIAGIAGLFGINARKQQLKAEKQSNSLVALNLSAAGVDALNNPSAANDYSTAGMLMVNEARKLAATAEFTDTTLLNNSTHILEQPWSKTLYRKMQVHAISFDKELVLISEYDGVTLLASLATEIVWHIHTSTELGTIKYAGFSDDNSHLFVLGAMGLAFYDTSNGAKLWQTAPPPVGLFVDDAAFSIDNSQLFIRDSRTVTLYDVSAGTKLWQKEVSSGVIEAAGFSADSSRFFIANNLGIVLYDSSDGTELWKTVPSVGFIWKAGSSNDGSYLFIVGDRDLALYDSGNGRELWQVPATDKDVSIYTDARSTRFGFSPDNSLLFVIQFNGVTFYDTNDGTELWTIEVYDPQYVGFSNDNSMFFVLERHTGLGLYDSGDGTELWHTFRSPSYVGFNTNDTLLFTLDNQTLALYNVSNGQEITRINPFLKKLGKIENVGFNIHDNLFILGDQGLVLYAHSKDARLWQKAIQLGDIEHVRSGNNNSRLFVVFTEGSVLYDSSSGMELGQVAVPVSTVWDMGFSNDNSLLFVVGPEGLVMYDGSNGTKLWQTAKPLDEIEKIRFSNDNTVLLVRESDTLTLYKSSDGTKLWQIAPSIKSIEAFGFSNDDSMFYIVGTEKLVLYSSSDGTKLWQTTLTMTPVPLSSLPIIWNVGFSNDDTKFFILSYRDIMFYDISNGTKLSQKKFVGSVLIRNSLSSYDNLQLLVEGDQSLVLYNVSDGMELWQITRPKGLLFRMGFSHDNSLLFVLGEEALEIYETNNGMKLWQKTITFASIADVSFSVDGSRVFVVDDQGLAAYNAHSGDRIWNEVRKGNKIRDTIFNSVNKYMIIATQDGDIELWDMALGDNLLQFSTDETIEYIYWAENSPRLFIQHSNKISSLDIDIDGWYDKICERAGRNLYKAEWEQYFQFHPDTWEDYKNRAPQDRTCPQYEVYDSYEAYLHTFQPSN